jgi:hypothetical protein
MRMRIVRETPDSSSPSRSTSPSRRFASARHEIEIAWQKENRYGTSVSDLPPGGLATRPPPSPASGAWLTWRLPTPCWISGHLAGRSATSTNRSRSSPPASNPFTPVAQLTSGQLASDHREGDDVHGGSTWRRACDAHVCGTAAHDRPLRIRERSSGSTAAPASRAGDAEHAIQRARQGPYARPPTGARHSQKLKLET